MYRVPEMKRDTLRKVWNEGKGGGDRWRMRGEYIEVLSYIHVQVYVIVTYRRGDPLERNQREANAEDFNSMYITFCYCTYWGR